jgi:hypothetical protein
VSSRAELLIRCLAARERAQALPMDRGENVLRSSEPRSFLVRRKDRGAGFQGVKMPDAVEASAMSSPVLNGDTASNAAPFGPVETTAEIERA